MAAGLPVGAGRLLDLGSGGGVPGLVLACEDPALEVVLLDAGRRRAEFLRWAVGQLGLGSRAVVVEERAEAAARRAELRGAVDVVAARSFGPPAVTAECAVGFLRVGGVLLVSEPPEADAEGGAPGREEGGAPGREEGGAPGRENGRWPVDGLRTLGFAPAAPYGTEAAAFVRCPCQERDDRWPRRVGIPAKRPLWR